MCHQNSASAIKSQSLSKRFWGQALDAFKEHIPDEPHWPEHGEITIATDRRIYVATYQTMLNIVRDDTNPLSPHFFDLVVIDESHRSIYN